MKNKNQKNKTITRQGIKKNDKMKSVLMGFILTLTVLLTGLIFMGVSLYGGRKKDELIELAQYNTEAVGPYFRLEIDDLDDDDSDNDLEVNSTGALRVYLEGVDQQVDGVSLVFTYDSSDLTLGGIQSEGLFSNLPIRRSEGRIEINGYMGGDVGEDYITEGGLLATFPITALESGSSEIAIVCGSTADSTATWEGENLIDCNASESLALEIDSTGETSTPTPTPSPTADPGSNSTPTPTPTADPGSSSTPTPTPTADPGSSSTPTPSPTASNNNSGGSSSGTGGSNFSPSRPPSCNETYPSRPSNVTAKPGPNRDQVTLSWSLSYPVTHYGITYGKNWVDGVGPNEYGAVNIGNVTSYVVNGLTPGKAYYFVVFANNGCANSGYSNGVVAYAGYTPGSYTSGSGTWGGSGAKKGEVLATPKVTVSPKATPKPVPTIKPVDKNELKKEEYKSLATPEATPVPEEEKKGLFGLNTGVLLPIIGGVILILLGILFVVLVKYLKQDGGSGNMEEEQQE